MAWALDGPILSSAASMVAASAVLMSTCSAAKAGPTSISASTSDCAIRAKDFMGTPVMVADLKPLRRCPSGVLPVEQVSARRPAAPIDFRPAASRADAAPRGRKSPITGPALQSLAPPYRGPSMDSSTIDPSPIERFVADKWDEEIVPRLVEYIRIPNKSPMFDPDWVANGYMEEAVKLMEDWARAQDIPGMQLEVVRLEGRTPLIFIEIPAANGGSDED